MASYVFLVILGFLSISSGCCSCTIPRGCSYCSFWDQHRNKELYQVVCQDARLTTIPNNLTYFLGNFLASYNNFTNITKSSFVRYSYLKSLILDHNQLEHIEDGSFLTQAILEKLFMDFNQIRNIGTGTFKGLIRLQRLSLRRNFISHLPKNVFNDLHSLTTLELSDNRITTIDKDAYNGLTNLESLYLGGNLLKTISKETFGILASLTMLDLSFNVIEEIRENSFEGLSKLELLHINDCRLKKLPKQEPFRGLNQLKELDLSTNPLFFLSFNTFINFLKLEILNLSSTNISVMHDGTFNSFKSLKKLYLNDNPLLCDCNLKWISEWIQKNINNTDFILEMKASTRCALPNNLTGKRLDTLTPDSFLCSCETCRKSAACLSKGDPDFCRCDSSWTGDSCNLVCNATQKHDQTCSSVNQTCYCSQFRNNSVTCPQNAILLNVSNVLTCKCIDGFIGNGTFCTNISNCVQGSQRCHPDAACNDVLGSSRCVCKPGFEGNGFICYPSLPRPSNVQVKGINPTTVLVMWSQGNPAIENTYYKCILQFKKVGTKYSWMSQLVNVTSPNSTFLKGLTPNTVYLLKVTVVGRQGNKSPASPVVEFMTKEQKQKGSQEANATSDSSFAVTLSLAISGSFFAVALLVLVAWCTWRQHRKSSNKRSSGLEEAQPEVPLDVLPDLQENHAYVNPFNETPIQDEWEIPRSRLTVGQVIGEGEFGVVREGTLMTERTEPLQVAIKSLKEHADRTDTKDFLRELDMFKGIGKHPNIVSLIGSCTFDGPLLIITEYVSGGTLLDLLRSSRCANIVYVNTKVTPALEKHVHLKLALDVAKGMAHIADHRFVHRDLAARNVLVTDAMVAKITDFGLARDIYSDGIYLNSKGGRLPLKWMSPESLQDYVYTAQSDVWSFGILIWEIWSLGAMPYSAVLPHELLSKLMSGYRLEKPPDCSNEVYDIMLSCWNEEPMLRPTFCNLCKIFEEILNESKKSSKEDAEGLA